MKNAKKHHELTIKAQAEQITELLDKLAIYERQLKKEHAANKLLWDLLNADA